MVLVWWIIDDSPNWPNFPPTIWYVNMSLLKGQCVSIKVIEVLISITNQCDILKRSTKCIEHLSPLSSSIWHGREHGVSFEPKKTFPCINNGHKCLLIFSQSSYFLVCQVLLCASMFIKNPVNSCKTSFNNDFTGCETTRDFKTLILTHYPL